MSTKTSIKRIAAVAAVALTLGGFSAVSAHATAGDGLFASIVSPSHSSGGSATETSTATAGASNYVSFSTVVDTAPIAIVATGGTVATADSLTTGSGTASLVIGVGSSRTVVFNVPTPTAGTITVKSYTYTNGILNSTAAGTLTITVSAAQVYSAGLSKAILNNTTHIVSATTDDTVSVDKGTAPSSLTAAGVIAVTVNGQDGLSYTKGSVSASVAGPALIYVDGTNTVAGGNTASFGLGNTYTASSGVAYVHIQSAGVGGTATVTVSVTDANAVTTVLATKTVTFTGTLAAIKAVGNLSVLKAGGTQYAGTVTAGAALTVANLAPLSAFATDANGNKVAGANIGSGYVVKAVSSDSTIITGGTCSIATAGTGSEGSGWATTATAITTGEFNCPVSGTALAASGKSATITVTVYKSDLTTVVASAAPVTFTIGGAVAKVAISTDAASYVAGAPVSFVTTVTDSSGNAAYDQDVAVFSTAPKSSTVLGSSALPTTAALQFIGGKNTATGSFAPVFGTSATITAVDALTALNALSTSFTVSSPSQDAAQAAVDAANEATDAANAATDAANNAMDSADAAQQAALDAGDKADAALAAVTDLATKVSAIASQIATLSALVKKIATKVKA